MKLKIQKSKLYKEAFKNNLSLCGVENGEPQFIGKKEDFKKITIK